MVQLLMQNDRLQFSLQAGLSQCLDFCPVFTSCLEARSQIDFKEFKMAFLLFYFSVLFNSGENSILWSACTSRFFVYRAEQCLQGFGT